VGSLPSSSFSSFDRSSYDLELTLPVFYSMFPVFCSSLFPTPLHPWAACWFFFSPPLWLTSIFSYSFFFLAVSVPFCLPVVLVCWRDIQFFPQIRWLFCLFIFLSGLVTVGFVRTTSFCRLRRLHVRISGFGSLCRLSPIQI